MTGAAAAAAVIVVIVVVAADGSGESKPGTSGGAKRSLSARGQERPLPARAPVGIVSRTLARLDPLSLKPLAPRLRLGEYHDTWSFSPDRSRLALGMGGVGRICGAGICIVDLASMRIIEHVEAPIAAEAVGWVSRRRRWTCEPCGFATTG